MKKFIFLYLCLSSTIYSMEKREEKDAPHESAVVTVDQSTALSRLNYLQLLSTFNSYHHTAVAYWNSPSEEIEISSDNSPKFLPTKGAIHALQAMGAGAALSLLFPKLGRTTMALVILGHTVMTTKPCLDNALAGKLPDKFKLYVPVVTTLVTLSGGGRLLGL